MLILFMPLFIERALLQDVFDEQEIILVYLFCRNNFSFVNLNSKLFALLEPCLQSISLA